MAGLGPGNQVFLKEFKYMQSAAGEP